MSRFRCVPDRRGFLGALAIGGTSLFTPGVLAELLENFPTPAQTEGPFYPNKLPLDTDNDLLILNDSLTPAVGEVTHLGGRVLDARGNPIRNAAVEIWQCDANGVYLHTRDSVPKADQRDKNFQGFGRFLTGSTGEYYFRTIKPVLYPPRKAPHIHFQIKKGDKELLTTQLYVEGFPSNQEDFIYQQLGDDRARKAVTVGFVPIPGSGTGELAAKFDIILGVTPQDS